MNGTFNQDWQQVAQERMAEYARKAARQQLLDQVASEPRKAHGGRGVGQLVSAVFKRGQRAAQDIQTVYGEPSSATAS
jgi:hypothetical protein